MLEAEKSKREFYEKQTKEQLIIFLMNQDRIEDDLRNRLRKLSGCSNFGIHDGMDGSCVECFYEERDLFDRYCDFENKLKGSKAWQHE